MYSAMRTPENPVHDEGDPKGSPDLLNLLNLLRPEGRVGRGTPSRHQPRDGGSGGAAGANSRATDAQCGGE